MAAALSRLDRGQCGHDSRWSWRRHDVRGAGSNTATSRILPSARFQENHSAAVRSVSDLWLGRHTRWRVNGRVVARHRIPASGGGARVARGPSKSGAFVLLLEPDEKTACPFAIRPFPRGSRRDAVSSAGTVVLPR